ncbi:hypothetical protein NIES4102_35870 [Chondrocystis sp. NIES-4102]|nr:hypothetical protein NIES4102_35870 [Chondrocystis sp. NIES-4102]
MNINSFLLNILRFIYKFFLKDYFSDKILMPLYNESHIDYLKRNCLGKNWISIHDDLEISLKISTCYCEEPSQISIRNNGSHLIEEVIILVRTQGNFNGYFKEQYHTNEQELKFYSLDSNPRDKNLSDIPRVDFWFTENEHIIYSFQSLSINVISVVKNNILSKINSEKKLIYCGHCIFLNDCLKGNWIEKQGLFYNISYINQGKQNLAMKIWLDFNPLPNYVTNEQYLKINILLRIYWKIQNYINTILCNILIYEKILTARFWILIMLNRHIINERQEIDFENYKLW